MHKLIQKFNRRARVTSDLYYALVLLVVVVALGTTGFYLLEGWSLLEALYATAITITTVGYGDFSPVTWQGRLFTIFFVVAAVGIAGYTVSSVAALAIKREQRRGEYRRWERKMKEIDGLKNHIILCGGGATSSQVAREFLSLKTPFLVIDPDEARLRLTVLYMRGIFLKKRRGNHKNRGPL